LQLSPFVILIGAIADGATDFVDKIQTIVTHSRVDLTAVGGFLTQDTVLVQILNREEEKVILFTICKFLILMAQ
jgi:hypothetical protein